VVDGRQGALVITTPTTTDTEITPLLGREYVTCSSALTMNRNINRFVVRYVKREASASTFIVTIAHQTEVFRILFTMEQQMKSKKYNLVATVSMGHYLE
jgi:hypothetical protein